MLQERIDVLENNVSVASKHANIQELKLKFIKESTETLIKQKQFILEDVHKSQSNLELES